MERLKYKLQQISTVQTSIIKDPIERNIMSVKNKVAIITLLMSILIIILRAPIDIRYPHQAKIIFVSIVYVSMILLTFYKYCSTKPQLCYHMLALFAVFYGPTMLLLDKQSAPQSLLVPIASPIIVMISVGNTKAFYGMICMLLFQINFILAPAFRKYGEQSPSLLIETIISLSNVLTLVVSFFTVGLSMMSSSKCSQVRESQEINQKSLLLSFSHELRNLINNITGNLQLTILEPDISEKVKDYMNNSKFCCEILMHLINNILDSGKLEVGELEVSVESQSLHEFMKNVWNITQVIVQRKGLKTRLIADQRLPEKAEFDSYRLTQVVLNLVGNAVKFTSKGHIMLSAEWIPEPVDATVKDEHFKPYPYDEEAEDGVFEREQNFRQLSNSYKYCTSEAQKLEFKRRASTSRVSQGVFKLSVTDTGEGFDNEKAAKMFTRFSQFSDNLNNKQLGSGLGLFITKELIEKMDGRIRAFSEPGKGSTFTICIPLQVSLQPDRKKSSITIINKITRKPSSNTLRVIQNLTSMVVDDQSMARMVVRKFLEKAQVNQIVEAENGQIALDKYKEMCVAGNQPMLITMDLDMPVLNGKNTCIKIREYEEEIKIEPAKIVIISGNILESEIMECTRSDGQIRAFQFLKKPVSLDQLLHIMTQFRQINARNTINDSIAQEIPQS